MTLKKPIFSQDKKRLLDNFMSLSGLQIFTYILPLITLPYLVRVLGVEKYGLVMFAQSFIIFFNILVDYGFNLSATREIAVNRDSKEKVTEIYSSVMIIKIIMLALSFVVLCIFTLSFERLASDAELYLLSFLMVVGQAVFPIWYFQGMEKMKYITIINILSRILFTVAIFVFVHQEDDYLYVPVLNGLGACLGGIYALWLIKSNFNQKFEIQNLIILKKHFKDSTEFFLSRVSVSIYTSANAFILGLFTNNTMVGYYSIAEKLYQAMQGLYGPINQALYPYVAKEKNIKLFKKIFYGAVSLNIVGVVFLFTFGETILSLLFTQKVGSESVTVFYILLVASLITVPSILLGYPFLAALGFSKHANYSVITGSMIHLIGLALLILLDLVTIFNVALMVVITEVTVLTYRVFWVYRYKLWFKGFYS